MSENIDLTLGPAKRLKVFISYSWKDRSVAEGIEVCLTACGVDVWLDQREIRVGDSIPLRVSEGLTESQYIILLMSENSMSSPWVQREWLSMLLREINSRATTLLPARLDDCEIPLLISDKLYADFRNGFLKGMSGLLNVFADQILEQQGRQAGINAHGLAWPDAMRRIIDEVRNDQSIEVAFLLNTLAYSRLGTLVDPEVGQLVRSIPEWLHGYWMSVDGWNAGHILTCNAGHGCGSPGDYDTAVCSFGGGLRNGIVRWVREVEERLLLFRWYQETSGSMGGTSGDTGFGLWCVGTQSDTLSGIWWYDSASWKSLRTDPTRKAYVWELKTASRQVT
jgi:hypothetical protein